MYEHLDISHFVEQAEDFIMVNDRSLYTDYCICIEKFCVENKLYLAGNIGLGLSLGEQRNHKQWLYEIWAMNPYDYARPLATLLSKVENRHIASETVIMRSRIKYCDFEIYVNNRLICLFKRIYAKTDEFLRKLYGTGTIDGHHISNILLIPNILLFENILHQLYQVDKCGDWSRMVDYAKLFVKRKIFKSGGKDNSELKHKLLVWLKKYVGEKGWPIIGLSTLPFSFLCQNVDTFVADFKMKWPRIVFKIRENSAYLVNDDRLIKYTLSIESGGENFVLCTYFNSTSYELVPIRVIDNLSYVTEWCKLRFLIVEIWILHTIECSTGKKIDLKNELIGNIHQLFTEAIMSGNDAWPLTWAGIDIPERVAKNKIAKSQGYIKDFIPALTLSE